MKMIRRSTRILHPADCPDRHSLPARRDRHRQNLFRQPGGRFPDRQRRPRHHRRKIRRRLLPDRPNLRSTAILLVPPFGNQPAGLQRLRFLRLQHRPVPPSPPTVKGRVDALHPPTKTPAHQLRARPRGSRHRIGIGAGPTGIRGGSRIPGVTRCCGTESGCNVESESADHRQHHTNPLLGVLGERVVNVVALNLALDKAYPYVAPTTAASTSKPATAP